MLHVNKSKALNEFAPEWEFKFFEHKIKDTSLISDLKSLILSKEKEIIDLYSHTTNDGGTGLGKDSLTAKFSKYNIFAWENACVLELKRIVRAFHNSFLYSLKIPPKTVYVGCWANIMRKGESISPHWHSTSPHSYLGAHVIISCDETYTVYVNPFMPHALFNVDVDSLPDNSIFSFKNEPGNLTFFPNWMIHYTTPHQGDDVRISIAMDIITEEEYLMDLKNNIEVTKNYVLLDRSPENTLRK